MEAKRLPSFSVLQLERTGLWTNGEEANPKEDAGAKEREVGVVEDMFFMVFMVLVLLVVVVGIT